MLRLSSNTQQNSFLYPRFPHPSPFNFQGPPGVFPTQGFLYLPHPSLLFLLDVHMKNGYMSGCVMRKKRES